MSQVQAADTLPEQLELTARRFPDHLAVSHDGVGRTWAEMLDESVEIARALLARGVRRGDHVGIWMSNRPEWLLLWLAATYVGAAVVPLNTRYKAGEAAYVLEKSNVTLLFLEREFLGTDYAELFSAICPDWSADHPSSAHLQDLRDVVVLGEPAGRGLSDFASFMSEGAGTAPEAVASARAAVRPDDTTIIVFTSGTTGFPKGVMHSHRVLRHMATVTRWLDAGPGDRVLGHLPLFHVAGAFSTFMLALLGGGAVVLLDRWSGSRALELVQEERISILSGIPTHFVDLLRHPQLADFDTSSLRTGWIGGSMISSEVLQGARSRLGMEALLPTYGMTETVSCTTLGRRTDPPESLLAAKGTPLGGYDVVVVDPETRRPVPVGSEGEIAVRGHLVMQGYYEEPEATAAVLDADGYFYTSDLGAFDERGYLAVTGRRSDTYIVGGNNVHPADVERVLLTVTGVRQAQVVAIPDERLGEVGVAFVETDDSDGLTEESLSTFCAENLASFKRPRHIVFTSAWPMTPTAKIQKFRLRELALQRYAQAPPQTQ